MSTASLLRHSKRVRIPSVLMRCGTSRALFFHRRDLPAQPDDWTPILLAAIGSADGDKRQINGVGGGSSTTSKVAVIAKSARPGIDVDYTFVQVPVGSGKPDLSGTCGNVASGVAPFAVDEGLVDVPAGSDHVNVRIFNTNTQRVMEETVEVDEGGYFQPEGDYHIGGFAGSGSRIDVRFLEPAGSMTGKLLPSGLAHQYLDVPLPNGNQARVQATLIDAANPFVLVDSSSVPDDATTAGLLQSIEFAESIRCAGAVAMGLASSVQDAGLRRGTPKLAYLSSPPPESKADIQALAYSMGKPHPSLQLTGAVCLGAALCVPGTVAAKLSKKGQQQVSVDGTITPPHSDDSSREASPSPASHRREERSIVLAHPTGTIEVVIATRVAPDGNVEIEYGNVARSARRIFEGNLVLNVPV